jgi:hypothetical protein
MIISGRRGLSFMSALPQPTPSPPRFFNYFAGLSQKELPVKIMVKTFTLLPKGASMHFILAIFLFTAGVHAATYYVGPRAAVVDPLTLGKVETNPWPSFLVAFAQVPDDGSTIVVLDSTYVFPSPNRRFNNFLWVRAKNLYRPRLTKVDFLNTANVGLDGFEITHGGPSAEALVVHIAQTGTHHITIQNCVLHDSYNNDIIKLNDLARLVTSGEKSSTTSRATTSTSTSTRWTASRSRTTSFSTIMPGPAGPSTPASFW